MQTIKGLSSPFFYAQKKPRRVGVQGGAKQTTTKGKHTEKAATYPAMDLLYSHVRVPRQ
jgi:hypothetical protein